MVQVRMKEVQITMIIIIQIHIINQIILQIQIHLLINRNHPCILRNQQIVQFQEIILLMQIHIQIKWNLIILNQVIIHIQQIVLIIHNHLIIIILILQNKANQIIHLMEILHIINSLQHQPVVILLLQIIIVILLVLMIV